MVAQDFVQVRLKFLISFINLHFTSCPLRRTNKLAIQSKNFSIAWPL